MPLSTLNEINEKTNVLFRDGEPFVVPDISDEWKKKLEALKEAELPSHYAACLFDARVDRARRMGFIVTDPNRVVELVMGEPHNKESDGKRHNVEWVYDHHENTYEKGGNSTWGGNSTVFTRNRVELEKKFMFFPSSNTIEVWRCIYGRLSSLGNIPYDIVLRINELKKLNIFNAFGAVAPACAWENNNEDRCDHIITAEVWEITKNGDGGLTSGQKGLFFIASW